MPETTPYQLNPAEQFLATRIGQDAITLAGMANQIAVQAARIAELEARLAERGTENTATGYAALGAQTVASASAAVGGADVAG